MNENLKQLAFDVEMAGEDFDQIDSTSKYYLTKNIRIDSSHPAYYKEMQKVKDELALSPLTGKVIAIAIKDINSGDGTVFYTSESEDKSSLVHNEEYTYKLVDEKEMLKMFWTQMLVADEIITFSGKTLDIPYLMIRSAMNGIKPSVDLMKSKNKSPVHYDLYELLTFNRYSIKKGGLHMWCRAFNIDSPKDGPKGHEITDYYNKARYLDIASYCANDVDATAKLFLEYSKFLKFK